MGKKSAASAINAYFRVCDADKRPYTLAGLACALGKTRVQLLASADDPCVAKAIARCEAYAEERLFDRETARGAEFILKNDHGWTERPAPEEDSRIELALSEELAAWGK